MKRLSFFLALILVLSLLSTAVFSAQGLSVSPLQDATESTLSSDPSETEEPAEPSEPTEPEDPTEPTEPKDPTPEPLYPKTEQHPIYVSGSSDGFFRPRASLTRSEFAQIIYRLTDLPDSEDCPFSDIPDNKWYTAAVRALAASGYMNGFPDGTFRPRNPVTRAQLVVVLSKIRPEAPETNSTFSDVPESHWSYVAVSLAQSKGWVSGYSDGTFRPNKPVTRAEAVTILNQFLGRTPDRDVIDQVSDLLYFPDVQRSNWFYYQVMEAAVPHDASFASPEAPEAWLEYTPEGPHLQDGFHCVNNKLYVVENGVFVRTEGDGAVGEVSYHCQGETGICTVSVPIVQDFNGSLVMIGSSGNPIGTPGQYQNGFYLLENTLYAVMKGYVVNSEGSASLNGVSFRCSGPEGVCTAQTEVLQAQLDVSRPPQVSDSQQCRKGLCYRGSPGSTRQSHVEAEDEQCGHFLLPKSPPLPCRLQLHGRSCIRNVLPCRCGSDGSGYSGRDRQHPFSAQCSRHLRPGPEGSCEGV